MNSEFKSPNNAKVPNTNILILGKSGIGKSTLLNYLWGDKLAETGTGKPCTGEGLFAYPPVRHNAMDITIYDSYGLEANKAPKWETLIREEVRKHDESLDIGDWFHTLIYCIAASGARIEDFEVKSVIRPLQASGNRICFVLTKCDIASEQEILAIERTIKAEVPDHGDIIRVCSTRHEKRNGQVSLPYGRENLLHACSRNLALNLAGKIAPNYEMMIRSQLATIREKALQCFRDNATGSNKLAGLRRLIGVTLGPLVTNLASNNVEAAFEKASDMTICAYKKLDTESMAWLLSASEQCLLLNYSAGTSLYNDTHKEKMPLMESIEHANKSFLKAHYSRVAHIALSMIPLFNLAYGWTKDEFWESQFLEGIKELEGKFIEARKETGDGLGQVLRALLLKQREGAMT